MKKLALAAIRGYQRWLSPFKGFSCAFRVFTGTDSCSAYGYRVIERFGLRRGLGLLDRRLALCGHVHSRMRPPPAPPHPLRHRQQGFCDAPCDASCDVAACDLPGCHLPSWPCDTVDGILEVLDCGSDVRDCWGWRRNRGLRADSVQMDAIAARVRERQERRERAMRGNAGGG